MAKRIRSSNKHAVVPMCDTTYNHRKYQRITKQPVPRPIEYSNGKVLKTLKSHGLQMIEFKATLLSRLEREVNDCSVPEGLRQVHLMNICAVKSMRLTAYIAIRTVELSYGLIMWAMHLKRRTSTPYNIEYTGVYPIVRPNKMTLDILLMYHDLLDIPMTLSADYKRITYVFQGGVHELRVSPSTVRRYYGTLNFKLRHDRQRYIHRRRRRIAEICFRQRQSIV